MKTKRALDWSRVFVLACYGGTVLGNAAMAAFWMSGESSDLDGQEGLTATLHHELLESASQVYTFLGVAAGLTGIYGVVYESLPALRIATLQAVIDTVLVLLSVLSISLVFFSVDLRHYLCIAITRGTLSSSQHCEDQWIFAFAVFLFLAAVLVAIRVLSLISIYTYYRNQVRRNQLGLILEEMAQPTFAVETQSSSRQARRPRSRSSRSSFSSSLDAFIPSPRNSISEKPLIMLQTSPYILQSSSSAPSSPTLVGSPSSSAVSLLDDSKCPPALQRRYTHSHTPSDHVLIYTPVLVPLEEMINHAEQ